MALVLTQNRKIRGAYARVREWNFSLDGLTGFGHLGAAGLDVYEEEEGVFFQDLSNESSRTTYSLACLPSRTCSSLRTRRS